MSLPARLTRYLDQRGARYELRMHDHSRTSAQTARMAQVPPAQLAKSVLLEDEDGCVMAVVPADQMVMVGELARLLGRKALHLSDEASLAAWFDGCEPGAVPPVGMAWDVETVVDDALGQAPVVYLEGGDHECLLQMSREQFLALMDGQRHGHFCKTPVH
jgi:Ala-tRNA(Pro) deacylase